MAIDLNRETYETEVLESDIPVMVDFWGPQCKPCLAMMPAVERLEKEYNGRIKVTKVNAAENRMLCAKMGVLGLPAYLFYKDGAEINRISGENLSEIDLTEAIKMAII